MMQSTMQDFPLNVGMIFRHGRARPRRERGRHLRGRRQPARLVRRGRRSGRPPRGGARASSASSRATASAPSCGTPRSTSRRTSRCPCIGAVLHTLNIRLFPEQLTYIVNHAGDRVDHRRRQPRAGARARRRRPEDGRALHRRRRRRLRRARGRRSRRRVPPLRGAARRADVDRLRVPGGRRARRRRDVLHERHHREPEGRRLLAPVDVPALDRHRRPAAGGAVHVERPRAADRPDVPRQRVGHAVRGVDGRRRPPDAGALPAGRAARHVHRQRASHHARARCPRSGPTSSATPRATTSTSRRCDTDHVRRRRRAARADGGSSRSASASASCRAGG